MGRPRQNAEEIADVPSTKKGLKDGYNRVTFIVKEEVAYKLSCIASIDEIFLKDVVNQALEAYVSEWEKKNTSKKIPKREKK